MSIKLSSPAFREGQSIPIDYTGDGLDRSPPLVWSDPPAGTASLALICEDPDAPRGTWTHWVLFNLPPNVSELAEGQFAIGNAADGVRQGKNDFGKLGYGGPAPPRGKPHHYCFKLYALDTALKLPAGATRAELLSAIQGHVLEEAEYMGTYQR